MAESPDFLEYIKHTAELQRVKLEGMTREETLAFFINIYNALVIHATVVKGPPANLWQRYKVTVQRAGVTAKHSARQKEIYVKFVIVIGPSGVQFSIVSRGVLSTNYEFR